jgi:hypothetical protein
MAPVTAGIATWVIVSRAELVLLVPPLPVADLAALLVVSLALVALFLAFALADLAVDPLPERVPRLLPEPDLAVAPERARLDPLDPFEDVRPRDEERFEDPR